VSEINPPVRACRLELKLGADNRDEILVALRNIEYLISTGQMSSGVSGGCSSGYSYEYTEAEHPTPEEYREQLESYLRSRRGTE